MTKIPTVRFVNLDRSPQTAAHVKRQRAAFETLRTEQIDATQIVRSLLRRTADIRAIQRESRAVQAQRAWRKAQKIQADLESAFDRADSVSEIPGEWKATLSGLSAHLITLRPDPVYHNVQAARAARKATGIKIQPQAQSVKARVKIEFPVTSSAMSSRRSGAGFSGVSSHQQRSWMVAAGRRPTEERPAFSRGHPS